MELQTTAVYGPVQSRRLGRSLGVNLLPGRIKACNFNCAYCQYGWTPLPVRFHWPEPDRIVEAVDAALANDPRVDYVTVAGNGEPTLHPAFARIVDGLVDVRARRAPAAKLAVLSNSSTLHRTEVVNALMRFDERHMKLDAGDATTLLRLNACPISIGRLISGLKELGAVVLQSMFVRDAQGAVDNTTPDALAAWLDAVRQIRPHTVHLYSIDRKPARRSLIRVEKSELDMIAGRVRGAGISAEVFG